MKVQIICLTNTSDNFLGSDDGLQGLGTEGFTRLACISTSFRQKKMDTRNSEGVLLASVRTSVSGDYFSGKQERVYTF